MDVHFGLDDGHQSVGAYLLGHRELLRHNHGDAFCIGALDDRTHLGTEHALRPGPW